MAVGTNVRGKPAVVISLVAHGVVLVLVARTIVPPAAPPIDRAPIPAQATHSPEPSELIVVAFLDDAHDATSPGTEVTASAVSQAPSGRGVAASAPGIAGDAAIAATRAGANELPGRTTDGGHRWMKMRGPELNLSEDFIAEYLARDTPIETVKKSGRVKPSGGGTSVINDRVTKVTIDRDGTAHFHDKPDVEVHWDLRLPTPRELLRQVRQAERSFAEWYADPTKEARVGPSQDVPRHLAATPGACDRWGDACSTELRSRDRPDDEDRPRDGSNLPIVHGKLELTDMLMRRFVGDPYASRKLALLDSSRAERADIGARHNKEDLARSAELMLHNLEALWAATTDPAVRREALFTLWDECAEGDGMAGEAGERARRMVIGWIRAKFPPGSPEAFTAEDIARLSAHRVSKQAFVPYD